MKIKDCKLMKALSCDRKKSIVDAAKILREKKQRRIIVTEEDYPVGIISTTDMNNRVVAEDRKPSELLAEDIMTSPIFLICDSEDSVSEVFKEMVDHKSFFVPVVEDKKLKGIITYGELLENVRERLYQR